LEEEAAVQIDRLDNFVVTVADIEKARAFCTAVLSMKVVTFGTGRKAPIFERKKIDLHRSGHEIDPEANKPTPGSGDVCLVAVTPPDEIIDPLGGHGTEILRHVNRISEVARIPIRAAYRHGDLRIVPTPFWEGFRRPCAAAGRSDSRYSVNLGSEVWRWPRLMIS